MKKTLLVTLSFCFSFFLSISQIQVDPTVTAEDAVNNILLGAGVVAQNITFSGDLDQIGSFDSNSSNMPIGEGVIMGTGNVNFASSAGFGDPNAPGPGGNNNTGGGLGGGNFGVNDADLDIIANVGTNDAAVLEFDFEATGDSIQFNFVFGSEEYPEYVCGGVNDAFGFFLSGAGIDGGGVFDNNAINLAQVPGTDPPVPVTINTVNPGVVGGNGQQQNCDDIDPNWPDYNVFYVENDAQTTDPNVIEYDGFTVVLTAKAAVTCGETYHIKMAIADGGDTAFDSAVFLQAGSFESNAVFITNSTAIGGSPIFGGDSLVVEGCNDATFTFIRPNSSEEDTIYFEILGAAENGVDYTEIADSIIIPAGETVANVNFNAIDDGITEDLESIILRYIYENSCGQIDTAISQLWVADYIDPELTFNDSSLPCPGDPFTIVPETSGFGPFTYEWDDTSTEPTLVINPDVTTTYSLEITDVCGMTVSEEVTIEVIDWPDLVLTALDGNSDCPGSPVTIGVEASGGSPGYTYEWFLAETESSTTVSPEITTEYDVTVSDQCESQTITLTANVADLDQNIFTNYDDSLCLGSTESFINLTGGTGNYIYNVYEFTTDSLTPNAITIAESENGTSYTGNAFGFYTIEIVDDCPWVNSFEAIVQIVNCDTFIPNVFSPDGDGDESNET